MQVYIEEATNFANQDPVCVSIADVPNASVSLYEWFVSEEGWLPPRLVDGTVDGEHDEVHSWLHWADYQKNSEGKDGSWADNGYYAWYMGHGGVGRLIFPTSDIGPDGVPRCSADFENDIRLGAGGGGGRTRFFFGVASCVGYFGGNPGTASWVSSSHVSALNAHFWDGKLRILFLFHDSPAVTDPMVFNFWDGLSNQYGQATFEGSTAKWQVAMTSGAGAVMNEEYYPNAPFAIAFGDSESEITDVIDDGNVVFPQGPNSYNMMSGDENPEELVFNPVPFDMWKVDDFKEKIVAFDDPNLLPGQTYQCDNQ